MEKTEDPFMRGDDPGGWIEGQLARSATRQYWHRTYNDGRCDPMENWPLRVEYESYKMWAD